MSDWADEDLVPISALQHYLYCPRQCALIHVEQVFEENLYTLRGHAVHERAHEEGGESRGDLRVERALHLKHLGLGLIGISDVVEFDRLGTPFPVEYKSGSKKNSKADLVQLAAQAMCLEEMFHKSVNSGALFYFASKKRLLVSFDAAVKDLVIDTTNKVREIIKNSIVPAPIFDARCPNCSLIDICQPQMISNTDGIESELDALFKMEEY